MLQDRFVKIMLVIIAVLLALNLVRPGTSVMTTPATAQVITTTTLPPPTLDVKPIKGFTVAGLKEIVAVGDGKSFIVSRADGFMVYRVDDPFMAPPPPTTVSGSSSNRKF